MKHIKKIYEFEDTGIFNEANAADILSKMGKHASIAIINYLQENPELIKNVWDSLVNSGNSKVEKNIKKINRDLF